MCLLAFASGAHPDVPFVCIHNRDEDMRRPTAPPSLEDATRTYLGGMDMLAGGTWMGFNTRNGCLTALTNFRSKLCPNPNPCATSRGVLLQRSLDDPSFMNLPGIIELDDGYKGFTLVTANLFSDGVPQARVASNRPQPVLDGAGDGSYSNSCVRVWDTDAGRVHGFSNSHCDDPSWPKVSFLRDRVTEILAALPVRKAPLSDAQVLALAEKLAVPMGRTEPFPDDAVPDVGFSPLLPAQERELQKRAFIPASVTHRSYGTRAQTIVIADTAAVHMLYRNVEGYPDVGEWLHFRVPRPTQSQLANRQRCVAGTGHRGYRVYHSAATASPGTTPGVFGLSWQHMLTATAIVAIAAVAVTVVLKRTGRGG